MKTLFERLTLDNRDIAIDKRSQLPSTWTPIVGQLVGLTSWTSLRLDHAMTLHFALLPGEFNLDNFIDLFDEN